MSPWTNKSIHESKYHHQSIHTPLYSFVNEILSPFTYTDTDDYIILFYMVPLKIVSNLMMA